MKERFIILFIFILLLLSSFGLYSGKKKGLKEDIVELEKKYQKISALAQEYIDLSEMKKSKGTPLNGGLLSYIQKSSSSIGISKNMGSIKPLPGDTEVVDVLYQKLNLQQIIKIFEAVDSVSNLRVRSFSITRRFDDPGYADLNMQIEKIK